MSIQRFVAVGALLGLAVGLGGCRLSVNQRFSDSRTEEAAVSEVRIVGDSGEVVLDRTGTTTQIDRTVLYDEDHKPSTRFDSVENGVLTLNTRCAKTACAIDYRVHVPKAVKVTGHLDSGRIDVKDLTDATVSTDSGRISVAGASGNVNATTDSGRVDVSDVRGRLNVKTDSGSIRVGAVGDSVTLISDSGSINASGLGGAQTSAQTESGSISLTLATAQNVTAHTDSGRITVTVPATGSFRVHQSSDSGRVRVDIPTTTNGKFLIDVSTDSGNITVTPGDALPLSPNGASSGAPSAGRTPGSCACTARTSSSLS
jgi:DUF4097 and DUF4098 domain-containing protein YvlB